MNPRLYPEQRGNGTAKRLERKRVKREQERQRLEQQRTQQKTEEPAKMQVTTETGKRSYTQKRLIQKDIEAIEALVDAHGELTVLSWLAKHPRALVAQNPMGWARGALKSLRDPMASHKATLLDVAVELLTNFGKPQSAQRAEAVPVPIEVKETRVVAVAPTAVEYLQPDVQAATPRTIEFNEGSIRLVIGPDCDPWFVAKDLVEAVGATWSGHSLDHVPSEYRGMESVSTPSGVQQMVCLSEGGMNFYLIRSDKPAALPLQKKIASDVLIQIRKTGRYKATGAAPQLPPPALDYQAMGTAMGTVVASAVTSAVTGAVITAIREFLPRRSPRRRKPEMNPDQQTIPEANLRLVPDPPPVPRKDTSHLLMGHPRLQRMPRPADVKDPKLFQTLRNAIDAYGQITSNFDEPYLLVYDEINRTFDPELTKRKHGERIQFIGSQSAKYQRQAYEAAYRVLVAPYLKAAS